MIADVAETLRGLAGLTIIGLLIGFIVSIPFAIAKVNRAKKAGGGNP